MGPSSGRRQFLNLLEAPDLQTLEDRIVGQVVGSLREMKIDEMLPIRLSRVAPQFSVRPTPEYISGSHDGEIRYDQETRLFIIRLCCDRGQLPLDDVRQLPRLRFTYAHEMAHRFFFVQKAQGWIRALEAVTVALKPSLRLQELVTLSRIEEGLCNNIARRLLIPDKLLESHCPLSDWFGAGEQLFQLLTREARAFGVSRQCLLVRLQKAADGDLVKLGGPNCLILVGTTRGAITSRGPMKLRVVTAILPHILEDLEIRRAHPGLGCEKLGEEVYDFTRSRLMSGQPSFGAVHLHVRLAGTCEGEGVLRTATLDGWSQILKSTEKSDGRSILLWGSLAARETFA
jgi:hypothetical protein